jgi:hypothetical protein
VQENVVPTFVQAPVEDRAKQVLFPKRSDEELLGHREVATTMIYTHVLNRGGLDTTSPLDRM